MKNKAEYDKSYVIIIIGLDRFNLVRNDYRQNLHSLLDLFEDLKIANQKISYKEIISLIRKYKISQVHIKNAIPISPTEFKIYDSCFSNKKQKSQIENYERVLYELTCNSSNDFLFKNELMVLYTNMYSYMYQGALLNEEREGDGYYFYNLNTIICKNSQLFCKKVWAETNELVKSQNNDLYDLYNCRCRNKKLNELPP